MVCPMVCSLRGVLTGDVFVVCVGVCGVSCACVVACVSCVSVDVCVGAVVCVCACVRGWCECVW